MTRAIYSDVSKPSRRIVLVGAAACALAPSGCVADPSVFKVGTLPFGTVRWEIDTLIAHGFDRDAGIKVENVPLASTEAARIAFLSGSVDAITNDLLFAARLRAEHKPVLYMPHSSTEGALVVPAASSIKTLADVKGKSIGVAGGPLDKSWLVLRAAALKSDKLDLDKDARPVFGAPPLLSAKVESGELDGALLYWSQAARLEAKGYRQVVSVEDVLEQLGAKGKVAIVGYLFKSSVDQRVLEGFHKAIRRTQDLLASDPQAWSAIRPMMEAKDEATFEALKKAYLRGIPRKPRAEEIADAQSFYSIVARLGGAALVGPATTLPEGLYVDRAIYG